MSKRNVVKIIDRQMDELLHIKTGGIREWGTSYDKYHRHESTSYEALKKLVDQYSFKQDDHFIDVGCGNGRVAFYIHHFAKIAVTGVEAHPLTFRDLTDNKETYQQYEKRNIMPLTFKQLYVEQYQVEPTASIFYFFNPFHVRIFKQMLDKIRASQQIYPREITIILYYPSMDYEEFLDRYAPVQLQEQIDVAMEKDANERILIYKLT